MNRKQRRAALKANASADTPGDIAGRLFAEAAQHERQNKLEDAARAYKRFLARQPEDAAAHAALGRLLHRMGRLGEASASFSRAFRLTPQVFDQYGDVLATLAAVLPPLAQAMTNAHAAWPRRLTPSELFGAAGLASIAGDPLLLLTLQTTPARELALERLLTSMRAALLSDAVAGAPADDDVFAFACTLARQCFINEYVFAVAADEGTQAADLAQRLAAGAALAPLQIAALAMYAPLGALPTAEALTARAWPPALEAVLTQQLREPAQERALRGAIAQLTPLDDSVSQRVRAQYEENPYPRWVMTAGQVQPVAIDAYLRDQFPTAPFAPLGARGALDVLVAGCGTGWQAIGLAQKFSDTRLLAVDLSLSSLCYAKRSTPAALASRIDYAQADILKLGGLARRFDVVDSSGVLHHLADPFEGWRILLGLVRPGGLMHLGFYSERGRRDVVAARQFIAERGFSASAADIRRCREALLETPLRSLTRMHDFFTASECRDLLFHVQESRMTIPALKDFIAAQDLLFLGFEFEPVARERHRAFFADAGWSLGDLDRWHEFEERFPDTFAAMYQFWVQKR
ncbi:MAG: methyltransferase domain-containing protein [Pseudolabrys sp.]